MSTQNKADKEWDDFIKKSLEKPDFPFDPRAWQAMEKKLDRRQAWRHAYRRGFFGLLALLFITTGVWYGLTESGQSHTGKRRQEALIYPQLGTEGVEPTARTNTATIENQIGKASTPPPSNHSIPPEVELSEDPFITTTKAITTTPAIRKGNENDPLLYPKKGRDIKEPESKYRSYHVLVEKDRHHTYKASKQALTAEDEPAREDEDTATKENIFSTISQHKKGSDQNNLRTTDETNTEVAELSGELNRKGNLKGESVDSEPNKMSSDESIPWADRPIPQNQEESAETGKVNNRSLQFRKMGEEADLQEWPAQHPGVRVPGLDSPDTTLAKRRSPLNTNKWSLNLVLAPDLSTVGFGHFTTPGMSQGLGLEYQISKRISVQLGALYSSKVYFAGPDDYQPAKPWQYGKPERIDGNCKVLDLPLNLRYKVLLKEKYAFYLSTGLSSYLMRSERYEYVYPGYSNANWSAPTRNNHWFGVVNMSVGYERKVSRRLSLQVEPYVKVPLAGVGAGKVKLITTGAFFVLKYHMGK
jgi:hypothetical protein